MPMEEKQFKRIPRGEINEYVYKTRRDLGISPNDRGKVITTKVTHGYEVDLTGNAKEMADQLEKTDRQYCEGGQQYGHDNIIPLTLGSFALGFGLLKLSDLAEKHNMNKVSVILKNTGFLSCSFGMIAGTVKGAKVLGREYNK